MARASLFNDLLIWPARFWRARRGVAASEFALLLPVMIGLLVGTAELGNALLIDRKVTRAAHVGADLVAQVQTITTGDLTDIFDAIEAVLSPFNVPHHIVISSVVHDPATNTIRVDWSLARNGQAHPIGSTYNLPETLVSNGDSVIVTEISVDYTPLYGDLIFLGTFNIRDEAYLRPRRSLRVTRL